VVGGWAAAIYPGNIDSDQLLLSGNAFSMCWAWDETGGVIAFGFHRDVV
jgi:hypothetical protein